MRYMLDTDISIYLIKNHPPALRERFDSLRGELCISVITLGNSASEPEVGAPHAEHRRRRELCATAARNAVRGGCRAHFGELRAHLARAGTPVGPFDLLIGAHARSESLILVTNNIREFARMPGLQVELGRRGVGRKSEAHPPTCAAQE